MLTTLFWLFVFVCGLSTSAVIASAVLAGNENR